MQQVVAAALEGDRSDLLPRPRRRRGWRRGPPTWIGRLAPATAGAGPPVAGESPGRPFPGLSFGSVGEAGPEARGRQLPRRSPAPGPGSSSSARYTARVRRHPDR